MNYFYVSIKQYLINNSYNLVKVVHPLEKGIIDRYEYWENEEAKSVIVEVLISKDAFVYQMVGF